MCLPLLRVASGRSYPQPRNRKAQWNTSARGPRFEQGPRPEYFTGSVRIDPLNTAPEPARVSCASVTFEPGARTAWHTHPLGQTLMVAAGGGLTQCEGGPMVESRPGDWFGCPASHRHGHWAAPTTPRTYI